MVQQAAFHQWKLKFSSALFLRKHCINLIWFCWKRPVLAKELVLSSSLYDMWFQLTSQEHPSFLLCCYDTRRCRSLIPLYLTSLPWNQIYPHTFSNSYHNERLFYCSTNFNFLMPKEIFILLISITLFICKAICS